MTNSLRSAVPVLLCVAGVATGVAGGIAGAQGTPPASATSATACDPGTSQAVAKATLFLQQAASSVQAKQDATKPLKLAIGALTTPSKDAKEAADSVGRAYYLGQAYILMLEQAGVAPSGPRASYGIASQPTANVDLLAAADSAFTLVEKSQPGCRTEITQWREQKPWLDAMNAAIAAVNAEHYDSAEVFARRALTIDRRAPYAYTVLASVASNKKDNATAVVMMRKAIEVASADTAYNDARQNAMYDLGNALFSEYDAASGTQKSALGRETMDAWIAYVPVGAQDARVARALSGASQIALAMKDTADYPKIYAPVLANPSRFGDQALLNAGVIATQANRSADAIALFDAVAMRNPYQRDALKNLAASYIGAKQPEKVGPIVDKLVALDPNNASNWLLYAYAYAGMLKGTKDPKLTKAYTDSLVKYNTKSETMTPDVQVQEFSISSEGKAATLGGTIANRGAAAKSYTMNVEFLDKSGAVVGSQSVTVGPVAPKSSAPFKATIQAPGVVGYRYKPIV
ncbi:MAG: FxLYD domain-containing protein [Gemmatimonadota bacterium]|nr:FxLYD domain-containing protein [Gemmatimonadota bacterium]